MKAASKRATTAKKGRKTSSTGAKASGQRKNTTKQTAGNKQSAAKKRNTDVRRKSIEEMNEYQDHLAFEQGMTMLILGIFAILCYLSLLRLAGRAGIMIGGILVGLFGWLAWLLPVGILLAFVFSMVNRQDSRVPRKIASACAIILCLAALTDLMAGSKVLSEFYQENRALHRNTMDCVYLALKATLQHGMGSGGMFGRWITQALTALLGSVGAGAVLVALLLVSFYVFYGIEMMAMLRKRNAYYQEMEQAYEVISKQDDYKKPSYQMRSPRGHRKIYSGRAMQSVDLQQMNEQIDQQEMEQKAQRQEKAKAKPVIHSHKEMEEILPDKRTKASRRSGAAAEPVVLPEEKRQIESKPEIVASIPIYREEMQQKFGKTPEKGEQTEDKQQKAEEQEKQPRKERKTPERPMASFAPKEEVTDVTPSSQLKKQGGKEKVSPNATVMSEEVNTETESKAPVAASEQKPYEFPPLDLLSVPQNVQGRVSDEQLRDTALKLQETLRSFNVNVTMGAVTCGPTVTRYELLPEQGVRVNKITNLADDLKLSLAAASIRIEAPIPGKAAVGIEVPNPESSPVFFRELLDGDAFKKAKSQVTFAVGKDIAGKLILTDIAKMPHLLIAGATGSGKSVCINTLIMSILYKADPSDVKLIMIDPKVVELSVYNGIPHLFCPVVTDPKEAAAALNWAVREMMERYNKFKELGVRNISGYNQKIQTVENAAGAGYEKMPSLVIIVDEFADLMMVASKEVEDAVCRLAQLARAAGIHLVLATQRPSVNVITGVIKANIPSRIAFSVSSAIDSRTILDKGGAEKLLGKGDMLFFPSGYSEPVRVQGAFISDKEVSSVVDFLRASNEQPEYNHEVTEIKETPPEQVVEKATADKPDQDEYFADAGRFVIESERAAAGQLQRRFSIGFNRAGRIIDQLHKAGVVGPAEGTKPRKVLMSAEEFEAYLSGTPISEIAASEMQSEEESGELTATVEENSLPEEME